MQYVGLHIQQCVPALPVRCAEDYPFFRLLWAELETGVCAQVLLQVQSMSLVPPLSLPCQPARAALC